MMLQAKENWHNVSTNHAAYTPALDSKRPSPFSQRKEANFSPDKEFSAFYCIAIKDLCSIIWILNRSFLQHGFLVAGSLNQAERNRCSPEITSMQLHAGCISLPVEAGYIPLTVLCWTAFAHKNSPSHLIFPLLLSFLHLSGGGTLAHVPYTILYK